MNESCPNNGLVAPNQNVADPDPTHCKNPDPNKKKNIIQILYMRIKKV